jgi:P-type Cu+ transporter
MSASASSTSCSRSSTPPIDCKRIGTADVEADIERLQGEGKTATIVAADITLMRGDLRSVPQAIELSKRTLTTIKWNLFWAFIYNIIGISIAAGVLYPFFGWQLSPIIAAAAMAFSSVFVVSNSLRLRGMRLEAQAAV